MSGGLCARCGHPADPHVIAGYHSAPEFTHGYDVPICGWMACPEPDCACWSTWSLSFPDMPPGLVAAIDRGLAEVRATWGEEPDHTPTLREDP